MFKSGDANDTSNYRGISIVSCLGKLFTYLFNNSVVLKCIIEEGKRKKQAIMGCFIDLKKAFDTVWTQGLMYKMFHNRISPKFIRLINHMYKNLKSRVKANDAINDSFQISIVTSQGCNLSPHVFNLYLMIFRIYWEKLSATRYHLAIPT